MYHKDRSVIHTVLLAYFSSMYTFLFNIQTVSLSLPVVHFLHTHTFLPQKLFYHTYPSVPDVTTVYRFLISLF